MNLYLVRHGESLGNVDSSAYHQMLDCDVPLTEKGALQSLNVASKLNSKFQTYASVEVYHSPYLRAKDTAFRIFDNLKMRKEKYESPLLVERDWADLRNIIDSKNFDRKTHFNFFYRPLNGESFLDCYKRVIMFFDYLRQNSKTNHVVIVSHGEWIALALMYLDKMTVENFSENRPKIKNCSIIERTFY